MLLDVDYILLGLPGVLTSLWAWRRSRSIRERAARQASASGLSGGEAALSVMRAGGIDPVPIDVAAGPLANHYVASRRRLRLSEEVVHGRSLAALGMASQQAGHVLQAAARSPWSLISRVLVPAADLGSILAWLLLLAGLSLGLFRLTVWGLAVFSLAVVTQLMLWPAEADAGRRAIRALRDQSLFGREEEAILSELRQATAWARVAAVLTGFPAFLAGLVWRHRRRE
jgi:Zn-dependent membrane protease YugP